MISVESANVEQSAVLGTATQKHFSPDQIAEMWGLSRDSAIRLFEHEPGVLIIAKPAAKYRRRYRTFRIPESVLARVHERMISRPKPAMTTMTARPIPITRSA